MTIRDTGTIGTGADAFFLKREHRVHHVWRGAGGIGVRVIAADLTNNLVPGAVLVPSVVAFMAELQRAGFSYSKGN